MDLRMISRFLATTLVEWCVIYWDSLVRMEGKKNDDFSSVQFSRSVTSYSLQPHELQHASLSITNPRSPSKPMSIVSVKPFNHLILCCPLLLLPSILKRPASGAFQMSQLSFFNIIGNTASCCPITISLSKRIQSLFRNLFLYAYLCFREASPSTVFKECILLFFLLKYSWFTT